MADPTNLSTPADTDPVSGAAAELRALKAALAGVISGGTSGANQFRKNLLDNGTGRICQRPGNGATNGGFFVDRWQLTQYLSTGGLVQASQNNNYDDTKYGAYSMLLTQITPQSVIGVNDFVSFEQIIEGLNSQALQWGTASAKPVTLSFQARALYTNQTVSVSIRNGARSRSYVSDVLVTVAGGRFTLTIPGDTAGTWTIDTSAGLNVTFTFSAGTTYQTSTVNAWQGGNHVASTNIGNFILQNPAGILISDVQLEQGQAATQFEVIDYATELTRCQRYFELIESAAGISGTDSGYIALNFNTAKRTDGLTPTIFTPGTLNDGLTSATITAIAANSPGLAFVTAPGIANNRSVIMYAAKIGWSCEMS